MGGHSSGIGTSQTFDAASSSAMSAQGEPVDEIPAGTMVGEYQIEGTLGEGGMGRVYAATHPVIAKRAAIKVLHWELSVHKEAVDRFVQEARAVNQIGHPNIVDIFSFGTMPDGRCYFVMEWLRGESLRDRIARSRLPLVDVLQILDTIAVALEAAHEKGIVHRDLKPDNIFLVEVKGDKPQVKLLDFGIAKLLGGESRVERTRTGNLVGTPAYISPEQARGQQIDHRTDIYALGGVAYELMTGDLPFPADNAADMIAKHLFAPPPSAAALNPDCPEELDALIQRLMAKEADARPTLPELREHLKQIRTRIALQLMSPGGDGGYTEPSIPAQRTPPPGMQTPFPIMRPQTVTGTVAIDEPPARRSRVPLYAIGGAVVAALVTVLVVMAQGGGEDKPAPPPAPAAAPPPAITAPVVTPEPPPPPPPVTPPPVTEEPAGSAAVTTPPTTEKPTTTKRPPVKKPPVKKPPIKKPPTGTGTKPPEDPDAPM